jgi:formate dehydrogenase major subunit
MLDKVLGDETECRVVSQFRGPVECHHDLRGRHRVITHEAGLRAGIRCRRPPEPFLQRRDTCRASPAAGMDGDGTKRGSCSVLGVRTRSGARPASARRAGPARPERQARVRLRREIGRSTMPDVPRSRSDGFRLTLTRADCSTAGPCRRGGGTTMSSNPIERRLRGWLEAWPVYRQLTGPDRLGRGAAAQSPRSKALRPRTHTPRPPARSVCPYCAVGCAQLVYSDAGRVAQIESDPDSPVSRGRLCPKGSASLQLVTGPQRERKVRYRAPYATEWTDLPLDTAMDMIADRMLDARRRGRWMTSSGGRKTPSELLGRPVRRHRRSDLRTWGCGAARVPGLDGYAKAQTGRPPPTSSEVGGPTVDTSREQR